MIPNSKMRTMLCPHCRHRLIIRASSEESLVSREIRFRCSNDEECGAMFVAQLALIRTIVPSRRPNHTVHIPLSQLSHAARRARHANENSPLPDNDNSGPPDAAAETVSE